VKFVNIGGLADAPAKRRHMEEQRLAEYLKIGLITLKDRTLTPLAQRFIEMLCAHARPLSAA
jgi:hypothetical protein